MACASGADDARCALRDARQRRSRRPPGRPGPAAAEPFCPAGQPREHSAARCQSAGRCTGAPTAARSHRCAGALSRAGGSSPVGAADSPGRDGSTRGAGRTARARSHSSVPAGGRGPITSADSPCGDGPTRGADRAAYDAHAHAGYVTSAQPCATDLTGTGRPRHRPIRRPPPPDAHRARRPPSTGDGLRAGSPRGKPAVGEPGRPCRLAANTRAKHLGGFPAATHPRAPRLQRTVATGFSPCGDRPRTGRAARSR
jgi:hypothetical protein